MRSLNLYSMVTLPGNNICEYIQGIRNVAIYFPLLGEETLVASTLVSV
jgi:hypothetical protein